MTKNIENSGLMKCEHCGYTEKVPVWVLEELNEFSKDKTYQMCCPECDHTMYKSNTLYIY